MIGHCFLRNRHLLCFHKKKIRKINRFEYSGAVIFYAVRLNRNFLSILRLSSAIVALACFVYDVHSVLAQAIEQLLTLSILSTQELPYVSSHSTALRHSYYSEKR